MKKLTLTLVSIVCAVCCVFAFAACSGKKKEVKNEKEWKQYIAEARESDKIDFRAQISNSSWGNFSYIINVKVDGNVQYLKITSGNYTFESYYDGEYAYDNVSSEDLGYQWKKYRPNMEEGSDFTVPKKLIAQIYSGELIKLVIDESFEIPFDGLDEISNRYADAKLMTIEGVSDGYEIEDNNGMQDNKHYTVYFDINRNYSHVTYNASVNKPIGEADSVTGFYTNTVSLTVRHEMADPLLHLYIPTESVQEVTAE